MGGPETKARKRRRFGLFLCLRRAAQRVLKGTNVWPNFTLSISSAGISDRAACGRCPPARRIPCSHGNSMGIARIVSMGIRFQNERRAQTFPHAGPSCSTASRPLRFPRAHVYVFFTAGAPLLSWRLLDLAYALTCPDPLGESTTNGFHLSRRHSPLVGAVHGAYRRLRAAAQPRGRRSIVTTAWMIWLAGVSTLVLLGYLIYALLRAEDLE